MPCWNCYKTLSTPTSAFTQTPPFIIFSYFLISKFLFKNKKDKTGKTKKHQTRTRTKLLPLLVAAPLPCLIFFHWSRLPSGLEDASHQNVAAIATFSLLLTKNCTLPLPYSAGFRCVLANTSTINQLLSTNIIFPAIHHCRLMHQLSKSKSTQSVATYLNFLVKQQCFWTNQQHHHTHQS